jgi:hypothetical protein
MKMIKMKPTEYFKEHRHLISVLTKGSKKDLLKEAKSQIKEVQKFNPLFHLKGH